MMSGSACGVDGVDAAAEHETATYAYLRVLCTGFLADTVGSR